MLPSVRLVTNPIVAGHSASAHRRRFGLRGVNPGKKIRGLGSLHPAWVLAVLTSVTPPDPTQKGLKEAYISGHGVRR